MRSNHDDRTEWMPVFKALSSVSITQFDGDMIVTRNFQV
jgi:hypothetical protein